MAADAGTTTVPGDTSLVGLSLADGLQLRGAMQGSGHRDAPGLVVRADGQSLSLTPTLYALTECIRDSPGTSLEQLRRLLSLRLDRPVSAPALDALVTKLEPLGVLAGSRADSGVTANPLLALRYKAVVSDPRRTGRIAGSLTFLFHPLMLVVAGVGFAAAVWLALVKEGLAGAARQSIQNPAVLLALLGVTVVSAGLHELGHAAACKARGGQPGAMGAGLYLVWPAFYTDVNDTYRLDRKSRLIVDLGGLWVNAVLAAILAAAFVLSGWSPLLLGVVAELALMLRQLAPIIRADGYHILADLTGVPDLFAHIRPTITGLLPWNWRRPSPLRPRARAIVSAWVLLVVPLLLLGMLSALLTLPRLAASTASTVQGRVFRMSADAGHGQWLAATVQVVAVVATALPVGALMLVFCQLVKRIGAALVRSGQRSPAQAVRSTAIAATLIAALAWAWWPAGQWSPIQPGDRGTVLSAVQALPATLLHPGGVVAPELTLSAGYQPALALVPRDGGPTLLLSRSGSRTVATLVGGPAGAPATARTLPFEVPPTFSAGGQRAIAVGTHDGGVVYDVAYALVKVDNGATASPSNEAWALASCRHCTTVAVSFQVVLVVGQSSSILPINAAVAANRGCLSCATAALAVQLVASIPAHLDPQLQTRLDQALHGLAGLSRYRRDLAGLAKQVTAVREHVIEILASAGIHVQPQAGSAATPTDAATTSSQATPAGSPPATDAASPSPMQATTSPPPATDAPSSANPTSANPSSANPSSASSPASSPAPTTTPSTSPS
ncbi:MAG: hypothetical protein NVS3B26_23710 [Mycobacteriales bacterium]